MPNSKISALTAATTPLAGTETVPIVQSGATVKATVANLTGAGNYAGSFTSLAYTTTLTGGTGIVNLGSNQFYKDVSGNIGIGVVPTFPLDVQSTGVGSNIASRIYRSDGTIALLRIGNSTSGSGATAPAFGSDTTSAVIYTNNTTKMTILSSGNVGIGVTPAVKLDVLGTVQAAAAATQDAVRLAGRAGGTGTFAVTLTPTTLTANRTLTLPDATTTVVGTDATQTLTNKRIDPRVVSAASASSLTPSIATADIYAYTALAAGLTINAPTGTPVDGNKLTFRLLDNGTARALTWNATYTVIGVTLPTTTVANKTTYVGCIYNANNTRWDVIAVATQA